MKKIYQNNITKILEELSSHTYQNRVWHCAEINIGDMTLSFDEAVNMLFDDSIIGDLLEEKEVIIGHDVTRAFKELSEAIDAVDEFRAQKDIIHDPVMQIVHEKAAAALALVLASDGSESTVEIIEE